LILLMVSNETLKRKYPSSIPNDISSQVMRISRYRTWFAELKLVSKSWVKFLADSYQYDVDLRLKGVRSILLGLLVRYSYKNLNSSNHQWSMKGTLSLRGYYRPSWYFDYRFVRCWAKNLGNSCQDFWIMEIMIQ
jgi:hypothetical protein